MSATAGKTDSATARPVGLRMRPDLSVRAQRFGQERCWVVKDPVALAYFHLNDEEHAILLMLDGRASLAEIKRRFEEAFAPLQMSFEQLQAFLGRLHESGLVLSDAPGQGDQLLLRHRRRRRWAATQAVMNVLAIRVRGVDPERFLAWLYPKCGWLFSRWFVAACLLLIACAGTLVAVQFDVLTSRLPGFHQFFTARNVVWLAVALGSAKVLHELGHALVLKHFGGECHELGILFLVFTPCLYCNVSDSWMLSDRWQRIAVSAAGIFVEVVLASVATLLWWASEPGLVNTLCLSLVFVCSVNTLLFNGNPLLRYDGYFLLSDLVARGLARLLLGVDPRRDRSLPERKRLLLVTYGVASAVYRWGVVIAILWFCYHALKPYRLEVAAEALILVVFVGLVATPVVRVGTLLRNPGWRRRVRRHRVLLACAVLGATVAAVGLIPLPFRVTAPVVLQPRDAQYVYVAVPGRLAESVSSGEVVEKGQPLARLVDRDARRQIAELTGERNLARLELENLRLRLADDPSVAPQIPAAEEALADVEQRLDQRRRDHERLPGW
jgi:putative peptide zinc metalloprotease protein